MNGKRVLKSSKNNRLNPRNLNKKKISQKKLLMSGIIVILIIINIVLIHKHSHIKEESVQEEEDAEQIMNEKIVNQLADMNERNRMEYYFATFINHIEAKEYEKAYNLLYDEFRQRYFPTLEEFQKYVEETFPTMMNIEHENIERNGDIYVLWIYISDLVNGGPEDKKEMNIVIKEDDLNDFVLSFSVI